jgi:serine/threonine protein phosphatase PrpC
MLQVQDQKVSPIPDVIVQNRNKELDEFIIVACDGIWDVQSNYEAVKTVADIFAEGESDLGLVAEELLDTCLMMGSKDNMTALILQFEAQKIGTGGGVAARRQEREEAENHNDSSTQEGKSSTLYT